MKRAKMPLRLFLFDAIILAAVTFFAVFAGHRTDAFPVHVLLAGACVFSTRLIGRLYMRVWRSGGVSGYLHMFMTDAAAAVLYEVINYFVLPSALRLSFVNLISLIGMNLIVCLLIRMVYRYFYQNGLPFGRFNTVIGNCIRIITGFDVNAATEKAELIKSSGTTNIAILGAGRIGTMLLREIRSNQYSNFNPVCYLDADTEIIGRYVDGLKVLDETLLTDEIVKQYDIKQVVFTVRTEAEHSRELIKLYNALNLKVTVYDYPHVENADRKRTVRNFSVEELLFRDTKTIITPQTAAYYEGKTVLITGGGGSIGSELCRQIAKMAPKRLVIVDVYENGAYDVQQELKRAYNFMISVEIITVVNRRAVDQVFEKYHPDIVLHAAAHKHVPLMENNVCEAVANNVFGTFNVANAAQKYGVKKFIMISTDKAVNPTNVMGATKRMCEMLVLSKNADNSTVFTCTRFGNVLGSNGSVIPLFKRQIEQGGPVTVTDKRIVRYFMTIPEASQLVLTSGAMAQRGELFVLDMGKPVKILELAENMIRLSGFQPYTEIAIEEVGLRPGEKLYEELLIKTEELDKTANDLIFVEREARLTSEEVAYKLGVLSEALESNDNAEVRAALAKVVPTFRTPEEVNEKAIWAEEMLKANA